MELVRPRVLPAEDGRRRRRPAGPALRRVEEVVTSRNDRRIDRPLLPERPPSGWQVSGTRGQAELRGRAGVRGARPPWTGGRPPTMARRPPARPRSDPCGTCSGHGDGAAGHGSGTATSAGYRRVQGRRTWSASDPLGHAHSQCAMNAVRPQALPDTSAVAVRPAVQLRTPTDTLPRPVSPGGCVTMGTGRRGGGR
jgi:hypothetical protein